MKRVAILQSNYIPWKGYFDLIAAVDEVIIFDDVQYTRHDWRNRNKIKTPQGVQWLTIPMQVKGNFGQTILETEISDIKWQSRHWKTLTQNYSRSRCFEEVSLIIEPLYQIQYKFISALNRSYIEAICGYLGINTKISNSWEYELIGGKTERLVNLCRQAGGTEYVSGPSANTYIEEKYFDEGGVKLTWFDYSNYSEYPQLWGEFCHGVTILDLLFNCGKKSPQYMRYV